jgi:hypothetical protein
MAFVAACGRSGTLECPSFNITSVDVPMASSPLLLQIRAYERFSASPKQEPPEHTQVKGYG